MTARLTLLTRHVRLRCSICKRHRAVMHIRQTTSTDRVASANLCEGCANLLADRMKLMKRNLPS